MKPDGVLVAPLQPGRPGGRRLAMGGSIILAIAAGWSLLIYLAAVSEGGRGPVRLSSMLSCSGFIMATALVVLLVGVFRRRAERRVFHPTRSNPAEAASLRSLHWPAGKRGGPQASFEVRELAGQGLRCVLDADLVGWVAEIPLPEGLIEPQEFMPGRPEGSIRTAFFVLLTIPVALVCSVILTVAAWGNVAPWVALTLGALLLALMVGTTLTSHPKLQRRLASVPILGRLTRGEFGKKRCLVGPGWIRRGSQIWKAGEDVLIIRRRAWVSQHDVLEVMIAGGAGRVRWTVAGTPDPMLQRLWMCWMHPDPRPEFASSDLS